MITVIIVVFGVVLIVAGHVVEEWRTSDIVDVEEGVESPAPIFADLPDDYEWSEQQIHELDG